MVMLMVECPSHACSRHGFTPKRAACVANVWRSVCQLRPGRPAAATHAVDAVLERRFGDRHAARDPQTTRPARTCSSRDSADVSAAVIGTLRRRPPFGVPSTPFLICLVTISRCATRSTSSHRSPSTSPEPQARHRQPRAPLPASTPLPSSGAENRRHSSSSQHSISGRSNLYGRIRGVSSMRPTSSAY